MATEGSPQSPPTRSGFVAIVGAPNVGKSTLLNQLLGAKVAIITPKPQTTRRQIRGILTGERYQLIFVDTPGIHESSRPLNNALLRSALEAISQVDLCLFLVDVTRRRPADELAILDNLAKAGKPVLLLLNKVDLVAKETLLPLIDDLKDIFPFEAIIPISAFHGEGLELVLDEVLRLIPEGPFFYEGALLTDQTREVLAAELIREKIFLFADQEVPYATAVEVEDIGRDSNGKLHVQATIFVEKPSQKGIIIGKEGRFIRRVRKDAERELSAIWQEPTTVQLWVKVLKDWSRDARSLKRFGLVSR